MGLICTAIWLYLLMVFARVIMSWFPPSPDTGYAQVHQFFYNVTEPVLGPVRAMLPPLRIGAGGLDLSPIAVFIGGTILLRLIGCG
jgi:YggT family protein